MNPSETQRIEEARTAISKAFARRQFQVALSMAIPAVIAVVLFQWLPSPFDGMALGFGAALVMTVFLVRDRESLRSRSGSMTPAILLVAFLWIVAAAAAVASLMTRS